MQQNEDLKGLSLRLLFVMLDCWILFVLVRTLSVYSNLSAYTSSYKGFLFLSLYLFLFPIPVGWLLNKYVKKTRDSLQLRLVFTIILTATIGVWSGALICSLFTQSFEEGTLFKASVAVLVAGMIATFLFTWVDQDIKQEKRLVESKNEEILKLEGKYNEQQIEKANAELNPQFLKLVLEKIKILSVLDPKKAERLTLSLSRIFRETINYPGNHSHSFNEEMGILYLYQEVFSQLGRPFTIECSIEVNESISRLFLVNKFLKHVERPDIRYVEIGWHNGNYFLKVSFHQFQPEDSLNKKV